MNPLPNDLRDILEKLTFISGIKENQKINLGKYTITDSDSWLGSIMRTFFGENRKTMIQQINILIDRAIQTSKEYVESEFYKIIIDSLNNSRQGLRNLCITYKQDQYVVAQLNIIIENININLDTLKENSIPDEKPHFVGITEGISKINKYNNLKRNHSEQNFPRKNSYDDKTYYEPGES